MHIRNESRAIQTMMANSRIRNLWWLLPPTAALLYPVELKALYESGKLLDWATGQGVVFAWLAIAISGALAAAGFGSWSFNKAQTVSLR